MASSCLLGRHRRPPGAASHRRLLPQGLTRAVGEQFLIARVESTISLPLETPFHYRHNPFLREPSMMTHLSPGTYFGRTLGRRHVGGFTLTESAYAPETTVPRHTHENAYLCAVLQGGYTESYGSREQAYRASDLVLHPGGQAHSDQFHREGGRCLNIEL